jgi:hypothetical protein
MTADTSDRFSVRIGNELQWPLVSSAAVARELAIRRVQSQQPVRR